MKNLTQLEAEWTERLKEDMSPHTVEAYTDDVGIFLIGIRSEDPEDLTTADVERYLDDLRRDDYSPSSVVRKLAAVRNFFGWLVLSGARTRNPTIDIRVRGFRRKARGLVDEDRIVKLMDYVSEDREPRDRLILALMAYAGLKPSEIERLDLKDLILQGQCLVRVRNGKVREIRARPKLEHEIRAFIGQGPPGGPLIRNMAGGRMTSRSINRLVNVCALHAGIAPMNPGDLRVFFVQRERSMGADNDSIKSSLGLDQLYPATYGDPSCTE